MFVKYTYLKKFLKYDKIIRRDHLVTCRIVHFAYLTVRREIKSFESDILTPTSKGRSGNRNHTYFFFWPNLSVLLGTGLAYSKYCKNLMISWDGMAEKVKMYLILHSP